MKASGKYRKIPRKRDFFSLFLMFTEKKYKKCRSAPFTKSPD